MKSHKPPAKVTRDYIRSVTRDLVTEYVKEKGWGTTDQFNLDLWDLYETVLYPKFEFEIITSEDLGFLEDMKILGKAINKERVILIDRSISPPACDARFPFTMGHEFGHGILHTGVSKAFRCTPKTIFGDAPRDPKEIQANSFSENLLMSDAIVRSMFCSCYQPHGPLRYIGKSQYCFTAWGVTKRYSVSNYAEFSRLAAMPLTYRFGGVSKESLGYKLHKLGLIVNLTNESLFDATPVSLAGDLERIFVGLR